jgi:hypothetical protein
VEPAIWEGVQLDRACVEGTPLEDRI